MRRCFLSVLLLFALPLSAAISKVQQSLLANVSSSTTCVATLSSSTTSQNLLVVWATWTPGNTVSVTSVGDSVPANSFPIAVGPTLQANASPQISAQIFYAANITGHTGGDSVTVQFSGTATTASCAAVEYSGADLSYPLDSTTAGFSNSGGTGTALDSGFAAPTYGSQNNLLIFGAGTTDAGTLATGGGGTTFSLILPSTPASSVLEQNIPTSPVNTLQHATATSSQPGNWLMQMAAFRPPP